MIKYIRQGIITYSFFSLLQSNRKWIPWITIWKKMFPKIISFGIKYQKSLKKYPKFICKIIQKMLIIYKRQQQSSSAPPVFVGNVSLFSCVIWASQTILFSWHEAVGEVFPSCGFGIHRVGEGVLLAIKKENHKIILSRQSRWNMKKNILQYKFYVQFSLDPPAGQVCEQITLAVRAWMLSMFIFIETWPKKK